MLRHAKSSWDDPALDDHDRPLAPRGRRAVESIAEHLRVKRLDATQVLCSSSRRTRETFDGLGVDGECLIERELYSASGREVLARLHQVPDEVGSVLVIGHNPAMQSLVLMLAGAGASGEPSADSRLDRIKQKFPTGALATLSFDGRWSELRPGHTTLTDFVRPKTLG